MATDEMNEGSTGTLTLSFFNLLGAGVTPTSAKYWVTDITDPNNPITIKDEVTITPSSSTYDLLIDSDDNKIIDETNRRELRSLTVSWTYGANQIGTGEYRWYVNNITGV